MKDIRFLIQDYARLNGYRTFDTFVFYNPLTGKEQDLIVDKLEDLIRIPSLGWRGSFISFRHDFETRLNYDFFYPTKDKVLGNDTEFKFLQINNWLLQTYKAHSQLIKNLDSAYRAGFTLEQSSYLELWVGPSHPHFLKDHPEYNMIFKKEVNMNQNEQDFIDDELLFMRLRMLQTMNETDILNVETLRIVYHPKYSLTFQEERI